MLGILKGVREAKAVLGFQPSRSHANWYVEIGDLVLSGCQANYFLLCPERPVVDSIVESNSNGSNFTRDNGIYICR